MNFEFAGVADIYDAIQMSVLNPGFLVLVLLIIGVMMVGMPLYSHILKIRDRLAEKDDKLQTIGVLFNQANEGYCGWLDGTNEIFFTGKFAKALLLNPSAPISLVDIQNQLDHSSSNKLAELVDELRQNEQTFSMQSVISQNGAKAQISGQFWKLYDKKIFQLDIELDTNDLTKKLQHENTFYKKRIDGLLDVINKAPIVIWQRDSSGKIIDCNAAYGRLVEKTQQQVKEAQIELIDTKKYNSPRAMSSSAKKLNKTQCSRFSVIVEGRRKHYEIIESSPSLSNAQYGYAIDVSEEEGIRTELHRHKLAHRIILEQLSSPIAYFNKETKLELFNDAYAKIFGLDLSWLYTKPTLGEIIDQTRKNRKLPEYVDYREFKNQRADFFRTLIDPYEELMHMPGGKTLRLMIAPHPSGGLLYVFDDITDKLKLERNYKTLMAVQKQTLDRLYEGIAVFGSDNKLRLSNPAAASIWNIPEEHRKPDQHLKDLLDLIRPQFNKLSEWKRLRRRLTQLFAARIEKTGQFILDDKRQIIQFSYAPMPDGSHMVTFVDVSDMWRMEQALKERNKALEQVDRIKTNFISNISYELRSPLNTVLGFTDILLNQYFGDLNERQLDYCKGINDSSERLMGLINDILDLANIEAGTLTLRKKPIGTEDFLRRMINLVHSRANDRGVQVSYVNSSGIETFEADESRLKQAIFNLLTNAIKHTPSGGMVTLQANLNDAEKLFILEVKDNGVGIKTEDQSNMFKLFDIGQFSAGSNSGAGVGLPLVKSLIELHQGKLSLWSQEGVGTRVKCEIPLEKSIEQVENIRKAI